MSHIRDPCWSIETKKRDLAMLKHIVIPIRYGEQGKAMIEHVASLAQPFSTRATLIGIMSDEPTKNQFTDPVLWNATRCESEAKLNKYVQFLNERHIDTTIDNMEMPSVEGLFNHIQQAQADLIVTTAAKGSEDWLIDGLLKHSKLPLLVVREHVARQSYKNILVPLDGSQRAESGLNVAHILAKQLGAQLHLTHIVQQPEMPRKTQMASSELEMVQYLTKRNAEEAERYLQQVASNLASDAKIHVAVDEKPSAALQRLIGEENIDLLVLSAHGYTGNPQWSLGSVAENLLRHSQVPTIILQDLPSHVKTTQARQAPVMHQGMQW
jgi:nucleotide-binding universal stress UspA family protein